MRKIEILMEYKAEQNEVQALLKNLKMKRDQVEVNHGLEMHVGFGTTHNNELAISTNASINIQLIDQAIEMYTRRLVLLNEKLKFANEALDDL
jgi:predicted sugar kinase